MKYLLLLCCSWPLLLWSQQIPNITASNSMQFAWNPAMTAPWESLEASAVYHQHWLGFEDAPRTLTAGFQAPIQSLNMSLGLQLVQDNVGLLQQTGLSFAYAYHLDMGGQGRLALGLLANYSQYRFDGTNVLAYDLDDNLLAADGEGTSNAPNFSAGVYYTSVGADDYDESHFYMGISAMQAIPNNLRFDDVNEQAIIRQDLHAFANIGYRFVTNSGVLEPSLRALYAASNIMHFQLDLKYEAYETFWMGFFLDSAFRLGLQAGYIVPDIGDGDLLLGLSSSYKISPSGNEQGLSYQGLMTYRYNL
ncbi:MAG: PorP/SprF family type IX secretion system membrane protein [Bacteroidota bacterium]